MIDKATVDRIKSTANIVEVVSEFVTLRKSGAGYKGLCPFHNEKTPSFTVSPSRGTYHCFGCGQGGNAVSFIMEHEKFTYPEALKWLAAKYGIEVRETNITDKERQEQSEREAMFIVNEWASAYFASLLRDNDDGKALGMQYYRGRGFRDDIIHSYRLGYDLRDRFALADAARKAGYKDEFLIKTGLCYQNDRGELIDRFAGRVVFPWLGLNGKVAGFSARLLDSRTKGVSQKYVNSPDSEVYHKEKELYGLYQAKKSISKENRVYIVEGQTDVLSMAQCGIENVVANSGTALSHDQINILHRFTDNITLLYDGDDAGIHAAMRGTDMLLSENMNVRILLLPDGDDPDSFARKHTADDFRSHIEHNQLDFIQFKTKYLLEKTTDPQQRSEAIDSIVRSISMVGNPVLRDTYLRDASNAVGIKEATLINRMNGMIRERKQGSPQPQTPAARRGNAVPAERETEIEKMITQLIVRNGEKIIEHDAEDENGNKMALTLAEYVFYSFQADNLKMKTPVYQTILEEAVEHAGENDFVAEKYFINHDDLSIARVAMDLAVDKYANILQKYGGNDETKAEAAYESKTPAEVLRDKTEHLLLDFRKEYIEEKIKNVKNKLADTTLTEDEKREVMKEYSGLLRLRNQLARLLGLNVL